MNSKKSEVVGRRGAPGLTRAMGLIDALAQRPEAGARLSDLARQTGLGKSTVHCLLAALQEAGLVERDSSQPLYYLGFRLYALGQAAAARFGILGIAGPSLSRLAEQSEDTVYLAAPVGTESVCLARVEGAFPIKTLTLNPGDRRPLGVGSGAMALLAFHDDDEIRRIVAANDARYRDYPFFDAHAVDRIVEQTRNQGHAFTEDIIVVGMRAVAVPILDPDGRPVAAITVGTISGRMTAERRTNVVRAIHREADRIAQRMWPASGNPIRQHFQVSNERR